MKRRVFPSNDASGCIRGSGLPSAATPATCGYAIEVPVLIAVDVPSTEYAFLLACPGAKRSTHGPRFEKPRAESL
jgi:hypothetical protein